MINKEKIAVVVPARNEEKMIGQVIKTMPAFVDSIIIVNDSSQDKTVKRAKEAGLESKRKIEIINLNSNCGVGGAIVAGYKKAIEFGATATAVMAGDGQMDPDELKDLVLPIINNEADYTKGNRLIYGQAWKMIPKVRYLGNSVLSMLTKITSGYWHVADSQTGYTVIAGDILKRINLDNLYKRYGFPNDLLVHLNIARARVKEIPIKPIYHADGKSGIRLWKVIPTISWLLLRRFFWRLKVRYIIQDFHPLIFFYLFSMFLSLISLGLSVRLIHIIITTGIVPSINALAIFFCAVMAFQSLFFAMWLDMDNNKDLAIK